MRPMMLRGLVAVSTLAGAAVVLPAQQPRAVRVGQPVTGTLTADDPRIAQRGAFHAYTIEAAAGARFIITMMSDDVDSYVWVARRVGPLTEELVSDDDSGGGSNARLRFRAPAAGTYLVVAQSLDVEAKGAYELRVEAAPPSAVAVPVALTLGAVREGTLTEESPVTETETPEVPYQLYTLTGKGERVRVSVRSGAFDAAMRVTKVTAGGETEVGTDDDSGGGTDAQMTFTADGEYRIYAKGLADDARGAFTISASEVAVRPIATRAVAPGETVQGTLSAATDHELEDGRLVQHFTITGRPGERYTVTLRSGDFDAFLQWGTMGAAGFTADTEDDDSAGDTDAKLDVTIPASGTWVLRASSLEGGKSGAFRLEVTARRSK